jgi:hypothetical protein
MTRFRIAAGVILVAGAYAAGVLVPVGVTPSADIPLTIACALVLAISIVFVANQLTLSRRQQFIVWFALLFLNLSAVAVEGTLFAPAAAPPSLLVVNLVRLAIVSTLDAALVATLFGTAGGIPERLTSYQPVFGWLWRLVAAAAIYVVLYLVVGGINFTLVTQPYYVSHAGSLTVPPAQTILLYEPVRGLLIALSVVPLTLAFRGRTSRTALVTGLMLFVVGGIVPLLPQTSLPLYLRIASLWEIFAQNFTTGIACAYMFRSGSPLSQLRIRATPVSDAQRSAPGLVSRRRGGA